MQVACFPGPRDGAGVQHLLDRLSRVHHPAAGLVQLPRPAVELHDALYEAAVLHEFPNELATLYEPFHVDRRGGVRTGESSTVRFPVFANRQDELVVRYLRYWIEAGHEKANQPLTKSQRNALDVLDGVDLLPRQWIGQFRLKAHAQDGVKNGPEAIVRPQLARPDLSHRRLNPPSHL